MTLLRYGRTTKRYYAAARLNHKVRDNGAAGNN